jgi:hypothetical protein
MSLRNLRMLDRATGNRNPPPELGCSRVLVFSHGRKSETSDLRWSSPRAGIFLITLCAWASIDVLLIAALLLEIGDEGDRLIGRAYAVLGDDLDQRALDVLGHALGIAADIDVGAVGDP